MAADRIGRYRIEEHLGRGGMGEVFKAWDERLGRWVALKSLHPGRELDPMRRSQLRHEARAVAALSHPSIAQIHDIMTRGERDYLVLEYVEGDNLATQLRERKLSMISAMSLANNIAKGLYFAHTRGIVHRDLKAANIVVTPNGQAKILDFGLAKLDSAAGGDEEVPEGPGELVGTLNAMSPEQVLRKPVDHRSDLFSLGTLLYEMTTFVHPFRGGGPLDSIHRITQVDPAPPHKVNPNVPLPVSQLICRLLEKDPEDRPQTAMEVVRVLERELESELEQTADLPRFKRPGMARRLATGAIAATALTAGAVVAWWWFEQNAAAAGPVYVAVLAPTHPTGTTGADLDLVSTAIQVAITNAVSAHEGVYVIPHRDVGPGGGDPQAVGRASGADEVVVTQLKPGTAFHQLTVRWERTDGVLRWMEVLEVPAHDMQLLFATLAANVRRAYSDRRLRPDAVDGASASPEDYEAFFKVGQLLAQRRTPFPELMDKLEAIRRSSPKLLDAYAMEIALGRYLFEADEDEAVLERSKATLQEALAIAPDDPRIIVAAIDLAIAEDDLERATSFVDGLEKLSPLHPACSTFKAKIAEREGRPDEAVAVLERQIARRSSWRLLYDLGKLEKRMGRIDDARSHLQAGLDLAPGNPGLLAMLAELEFFHGDLGRAEELYLELTTNDPSRFNQSAVAAARLFQGRYEEARDIFQRLVDEGSRHPLDLLNLADCHKLLGDELAARPIYEELARTFVDESQRKSVQHLEIAAQAQAHLGHHRAAITIINEALQLSPGSSQTLFAAALVYALTGDRASAQASAHQALELGLNPQLFNLPWFDGIVETGD